MGLKPHEEALILGGNILRLLRNAGHRSHLKYRRGTAATYDYREITADTIHGEFHSEPADAERVILDNFVPVLAADRL